MAELKRRHSFRRWAPDIGENRELEGGPALWLEIATGLTAEQLEVARERMAQLPKDVAGSTSVEDIRAGQRAAFGEALGAYVRVVEGPHTVGGLSFNTLEEYIGVVQQQADFGQLALKDLVAAFTRFNSFGGPDELFLLRRSGGSASTAAQSAAPRASATAAPSRGKPTRARASSGGRPRK